MMYEIDCPKIADSALTISELRGKMDACFIQPNKEFNKIWESVLLEYIDDMSEDEIANIPNIKKALWESTIGSSIRKAKSAFQMNRHFPGESK